MQVINKLCYKGYYLHYLSISTATVNSNDYTDKNYFLLFRPCHFQETDENCEMRYYTVLWKLCIADLNNVQN